VTAARWRFLLNLNGHGRAAARERGRSTLRVTSSWLLMTGTVLCA